MAIAIFEPLGTVIDTALTDFVTKTSTNVIGGIGGIALAGVTLSIIVYGYFVMWGYIEQPLKSFLIKAGGILAVTSIALGVGTYQDYVVAFVNGALDHLSTIVQGNNAENVYQVLDEAFNKGMGIAQVAYEKSDQSIMSIGLGSLIGWFATCLIIAGCTILITASVASYVVLAKVIISLLLAVGPIFILCLLWQPVRQLFMAWVGQIITFIVLIVFMVTLMSFVINLFNQGLDSADLSNLGADQNMLIFAFQILAETFVLFFIVRYIPQIAAAFGGGPAIQALNPVSAARMAGGAVSRMASKVNPVSTRRDMTTGHMETGTRAQHMMAGNTVINPAYSKRMYENLRKNWGGWNKGGK